MKEIEYKTCDKCCYDILDDDGNVMGHYCIDDNFIDDVKEKVEIYWTYQKKYITYQKKYKG